jgi:alkanesulfonate monooxygenase SsuD/methylene tetrahydromethanopterin reductase-like flavin-dependent oxidoreductase (luciferase family)
VPQVNAILRLNMSGRPPPGETDADRYGGALELAELADRSGFAIVNVEEHHDVEIGWLPSPLVMAGLIVSRTRRITVRAMALLGPLYDAIRLAEDVAILDNASRGRFVLVLGQGYRPSEYQAMDRDWERRGERTEELIGTLLRAWRDEPLEHRGRRVHVFPRPCTRPHPPLLYAGMSGAAAKRAAHFGLPFCPPQPIPELEALYLAECERLGTQGRIERHEDLSMLFVDEDPDRAWRELGSHLLAEAEQYALWVRGGVPRPLESQAASIEELRRQGVYQILTPEECLARARGMQREYRPILHPLAGGIPVARARRCVELFAERVLARL